MILIADSGSTKTDWALVTDGQHEVVITQGINPFHQSREEILRILADSPRGTIAAGRWFFGSECIFLW